MTHLQEPNTISIYLTNTANFDNDTVIITVNLLGFISICERGIKFGNSVHPSVCGVAAKQCNVKC
jgi:hypothetical protein